MFKDLNRKVGSLGGLFLFLCENCTKRAIVRRAGGGAETVRGEEAVCGGGEDEVRNWE